MATELRTLRRLIGDTTGDVLVLKATATSASASVFTDFAHLADRESRAASIIKRLLYFSGGTEANVGWEAAITDYDGLTRTLTFSPAAPTAPQLDDEAELWSVTERTGSIGALRRLINDAIATVEDVAGLEEYAADQTFDARGGTLVIPAGWAEFGGADWTDPTGYVREISPRWLRVSPGRRTVTIWGRGAERAHRRSVALYGYPRCTALEAETDATPVSAKWIVQSVSEAITLAGSWHSHDPAAAERRANFWSTKAEAYRRTMMSARRGLGIALP